jgi:N-methylhydantoinase B
MSERGPVDPVTLGVIWGALQSIAVEIGTTVHRTAYSEQAREGQDFSVAVFDPQGRMVAQGPYSPGHMGAMSFAVKNALAAHPRETLRPGDAILLNDPLLGSGHLPDFFVTQPAFHDGALVGFAVNILHHTDVGGQRPGSQGVEGIFDYFQEGLRILPTRVWQEYREQEGIVAIIAANTRTPDKVLGDLRAQRSALRVGELRLQELAARYGPDILGAAMDAIIARTEANMRAAIREIPDGVYPFEDFMDDYGPGTEPLRVAVEVTVNGDAMVVDYEGSSPQTASGMNSYINYTRSYSYAAVKCLADPLGPMNEGALRPITVKAPEGSFLNPRPPAGGGPRAIICYRTFESVLGALAPALPDRAAAAASHMANPTFGGWDRARKRRFVAYELVLSGTGARAARDGCEAMSWAFNASNIPVEAQEANQPMIVERFELIGDSGGAGKFRGGCGVRRDLRFLADEGKLTNLADRQKFAPYGLGGGWPGKLGRTVLNPGPDEQVVHGKESREFAYGDVISFQQSGAGGYGDPLERDPGRVLADVLDDYVSIAAARAEYGVVIAGQGVDLSVDEAATRELRTGMTADRSRESTATAKGSTADRSRESTATAKGSTADRSRVAPVSGHPRSKPASRTPLQ